MSRASTLALLSLAGLAFTACNAAFGIGDLRFEEGSTSSASSGGGGAGGSGGEGGATSSSSSTTGGGGAGGEGGMGGGGAEPTLVSRGLVVRYFLDEPTGTEVLDAAPDPLNLTMSPSSNMTRVTAPGRSGIQWASPGNAGIAAAAVDGTKILALDGSTTATIEIVAEITAAQYFDRFLHIGKQADFGRLAFNTGNGNNEMVGLSARLNDDEIERWNTPLVSGGRQVYHVVIDTSLGEANRARVFTNGVEAQTNQVLEPFLPNEGLAFDDGLVLGLGNRPSQNRSLGGTLYYAALYSTALDDAERANNLALLTDNDDRP